MTMIPHPPYRTPEFARWLNGNLTRWCGREMHYGCQGTINTIGIAAPCLCKCHGKQP